MLDWREQTAISEGFVAYTNSPLNLTGTTLLYQVSPADPVIFGGRAMMLLSAAIAAGWLPARRAAKVNPEIALRSE